MRLGRRRLEQSQQPIQRRGCAGLDGITLRIGLRAADCRDDDLFAIRRESRRVEALEILSANDLA